MQTNFTFDVMTIFWVVFNVIILIGLLVFGVYCMYLFVKLARRGIKALDIYLQKNKEEK